MADPNQPTSLNQAITPVGTCTSMCPEFERVERIVQKMVDKSEKVPSQKRTENAEVISMLIYFCSFFTLQQTNIRTWKQKCSSGSEGLRRVMTNNYRLIFGPPKPFFKL